MALLSDKTVYELCSSVSCSGRPWSGFKRLLGSLYRFALRTL